MPSCGRFRGPYRSRESGGMGRTCQAEGNVLSLLLAPSWLREPLLPDLLACACDTKTCAFSEEVCVRVYCVAKTVRTSTLGLLRQLFSGHRLLLGFLPPVSSGLRLRTPRPLHGPPTKHLCVPRLLSWEQTLGVCFSHAEGSLGGDCTGRFRGMFADSARGG